jgi:PBP1b-binding outer membrane lipoprotein LpoB
MRKFVVCCSALLLLGFLFSGCATWNKMTGSEEQNTPKTMNEPLNQAFYGFPDIPVPKELSLVQNKSFVYETQTMRVGVLVFSGNVDLPSLEDYFKVNMTRNGWKFVNSFKYRDTSLNFVKEDKTANIRIIKTTFGSETEIWIGPGTTLDKVEKGGMQKGNVSK